MILVSPVGPRFFQDVHLQNTMRKWQATVKEAKEGQDAVAKATEVLKDRSCEALELLFVKV